MKTLISVMLLLASASMMLAQPVPTVPTLPHQVQAVEKKFSLVANKGRYCVGESPRYAITAATELEGKAIEWRSSRSPAPSDAAVLEVSEGSYSQVLSSRAGFSFWSGVGTVWTFAHQGQWTKTAVIDGAADTVKFIVDVCSAHELSSGMRLFPESGATLFYRLGTNSVQDIVVLLEGLVDPSIIRGWRVVVDNNNATREVMGLQDGGIGQIFEVKDQSGHFNLQAGVAIRIPYPTRYLVPGSHEFRVSVELTNGSQLEASATYNVRPAFEAMGQYPSLLPDSKLVCDPTEGTAFANQFFWFYARGGNGAYIWSAPGSQTQAQNRAHFPVSYDTPGTHQVMVFSGGQSAACTVKVVTPPPSVTPQPKP